MWKCTYLGFALIVATLAHGLAAAAIDVPHATDAPQVKIGATSQPSTLNVELGEVFSGQRVKHTIAVTNAADKALLLRADVGCGCSSIEIGKPALARGESTELQLQFDSAHVFGMKGEERKPFTLLAASGPKSVYMEGTFHATVKPSVDFLPDRLEWRLEADGTAPPATVRLQNQTGSDVTLRWDGESGGNPDFVVKPAVIQLKPGDKAEFTVAGKGIVAPERRSVIETLNFTAAIATTTGSIEAHYHYPLKMFSANPLTAIPGSFVVGSEGDGGDIKRQLRLRINGDRKVTAIKVTSDDDNISVKATEDNQYSVQIQRPKAGGYLSAAIHISYEMDGKAGELEVPVFARFKSAK